VGHTIAEKILAAKSGRSDVSPGEIVEAYPDLVMSHTATWRSVSVMNRVGATKLYDPDRSSGLPHFCTKVRRAEVL